MHLTPDGQLTILPEIREQLGLSPDTELELKIDSNRLYIQKKPVPMQAWLTTARGTLPHLTTAQVMSLTRDDATE
jgi:bifunctional DNA-binding transcriptional regulator/antitoxin component of YhaV-PrlF toxin-antitoxin module